MAFHEIAFSTRFKRNFAFVSCGLAALHFVLETAYTIFVGQSFLGYLPDCIADVLLLVGAYILLKHQQATAIELSVAIYIDIINLFIDLLIILAESQ